MPLLFVLLMLSFALAFFQALMAEAYRWEPFPLWFALMAVMVVNVCFTTWAFLAYIHT